MVNKVGFIDKYCDMIKRLLMDELTKDEMPLQDKIHEANMVLKRFIDEKY